MGLFTGTRLASSQKQGRKNESLVACVRFSGTGRHLRSIKNHRFIDKYHISFPWNTHCVPPAASCMSTMFSLHFTFTSHPSPHKTSQTGMATKWPQLGRPEAEDSFYSSIIHHSSSPSDTRHERSFSLGRTEKSVRTIVRRIEASSDEIPPAAPDPKQLKQSKSVSCLKSNISLQLDTELATPPMPVKFQGCFLVDLPTWQPSDRLFRQRADTQQDGHENTYFPKSSSKDTVNKATQQPFGQPNGIAF